MPLYHAMPPDDAVVLSWRMTGSVEEAWRLLTEPDKLALWLGEVREARLVPGGTLVVDHGDGYLCTSRLTDVRPPHQLSMSWAFPDEPATDLSIRLVADQVGTMVLSLRHDRLGDLAPSYLPGWITHLTFLEAVLGGSPLPFDQFWNLHGTLANLTG